MRVSRPHILLLLIVLAGGWLRLHDLGVRPMHTDEANQAVKLGWMLEGDNYRFDPNEHHGPTLYYFALLPAWLRGETTLAALTEATVRLTPALFGIAAGLLIFFLARPLGYWPALAAAGLLALSPPAVYYSRYFIQETLLMTFTLGALVCGLHWWRGGRLGWALGMGACAGLMQATKASAPLLAAAAGAALLVIGWRGGARPASPRLIRDLCATLAAAVAVAVLFYTSWLTHPRGLFDALATFSPMLDRVLGGGSGHEKPWWYYAGLFIFRREGGLIWDQSLFLVLALAGAVLAIFTPRGLPRFAALYTVLLGTVLSLTTYKTPWLVVNLVPGLVLLAAVVLGRLRVWIAVPLAAGTLLLLGWQTRQAVFQRPSDPRNPYAYVHTAPDMLKVPALAAAAPPGPIKVISKEYWPLPWYLRARPQVGYWTEPPEDCDGALVFAGAEQADAVRARLRGPYRESYLGLRPGFVLVVFGK